MSLYTTTQRHTYNQAQLWTPHTVRCTPIGTGQISQLTSEILQCAQKGTISTYCSRAKWPPSQGIPVGLWNHLKLFPNKHKYLIVYFEIKLKKITDEGKVFLYFSDDREINSFLEDESNVNIFSKQCRYVTNNLVPWQVWLSVVSDVSLGTFKILTISMVYQRFWGVGWWEDRGERTVNWASHGRFCNSWPTVGVFSFSHYNHVTESALLSRP